jgi:hypothetical protein
VEGSYDRFEKDTEKSELGIYLNLHLIECGAIDLNAPNISGSGRTMDAPHNTLTKFASLTPLQF